MGEQLDLELLHGGENDGLGAQLHAELCVSSGRYLKERNPKLWHVLAVAISYGVPYEALARGTGVSPNTVAAIAREVRPIALEDHKKHILEGIRQARHSVLRRLNELLDSGEPISAAALGILFGILTDKEALESGGVTSRVQVVEDPETVEFMRLVSSLRQGSSTGLEGESLAATAERSERPEISGLVVETTAETVSEDAQSSVSNDKTRDTAP